MLEYFEDYPWNLALNLALDMGANIEEVDRACRDLRTSGVTASGEGVQAFFHAWEKVGGRLQEAAEEDERCGRLLSASEKYHRAAVMHMIAERMPEHDWSPRQDAYERMLFCFSRHLLLSGANCEKVLVPYQGGALPALFVKADGAQSAPCVISFDGLDGCKEFRFFSGYATALAKRGVSSLIVDNPGVGEALRKYNLHNFAEAEIPAAACIDYLESRSDVDKDRIGMLALSMGGHHAPRATAFEERIKCCVVWGASYNWGHRYRLRVEGGGSKHSVPHLFKHVQWVVGAQSPEETIALTDKFTLEGILDRIRVPILITHGELDRQVPVEAAQSTYDDCINSPRRELRIFKEKEGGEQHCHVGNMKSAINYMGDWISDVFKVSQQPITVNQ